MKFTAEQVQYNRKEAFRRFRDVGRGLSESFGLAIVTVVAGVLLAFALGSILKGGVALAKFNPTATFDRFIAKTIR